MPLYGWYSAKQERIFGYAHYKNIKGDTVCITKINNTKNCINSPWYIDSVYQGELIQFLGVKQWNCIKSKRREAFNNIVPKDFLFTN